MNTELADRISQKEINHDYFAELILDNKQLREDLVELMLCHPHIMVYYRAYEILDKAAERNPSLFYLHWDNFAALLHHKIPIIGKPRSFFCRISAKPIRKSDIPSTLMSTFPVYMMKKY